MSFLPIPINRITGVLVFCLAWPVTTVADQAAGEGGNSAAVDAPDVRMETGVCYGRGGDTDLLLDLAMPTAAPGPHPAIVFVHSGGWYTGNREQYHSEIREAAARGYVAATISYRLTGTTVDQPANRFPAQIEDVKCAIRWLRSHAELYHIDPDHIGIKGSSAGGHLSLLAAVTDPSNQLEGTGGFPEASSRVQAVVNFYGPTDLRSLHASGTKAAPMLEQLLGSTPTEIPDAYQTASPMSHLTSDDPPMLTIQGGRDKVVPPDQAVRFDLKAKEVGIDHQLLMLPEQAHGFAGDDRQKAIEASFEFFDQHLKTTRAHSPNVVLMMADDLGWGDTAFNGHRSIRTPNLDEMSRTGIRMNRFYAAAPVCSPTRGSCLTGRNALRYGIRTANDGRLPEHEVCLSELLSDRGYETGHFGKWHLGTLTTNVLDSNRGRPGNTSDFSPPWNNGFSTCFSTEALVPTWFGSADYEQQKTRYWSGPDQPADPSEIVGDDSQILMNRADRFIRQSVKEQHPFLAVIWFHTPHYPVVGGPEDRSLYTDASDDQQHYFAAVTAMDKQVGRLRTTLRELGVERNTMVWFCSDNGPEGNPGPKNRSQGTAAPFRGRKRSLYEGGIRVPGLLVWPEQVPVPFETNVPCVTSDFLPTIAEAAGVKLDDDKPLDGISLMPLIRQLTAERARPIPFQFETQAALSGNQFKLLYNSEVRRLTSDNGTTAVAEWELYDLLEDPGESINIAAEQPEVLSSMQAELKAWQESLATKTSVHNHRLDSAPHSHIVRARRSSDFRPSQRKSSLTD